MHRGVEKTRASVHLYMQRVALKVMRQFTYIRSIFKHRKTIGYLRISLHKTYHFCRGARPGARRTTRDLEDKKSALYYKLEWFVERNQNNLSSRSTR